VIGGFAKRFRATGRAALDLLLPPLCLTCDAAVDAPGHFCADCFRATGFITEPCCERCGAPFERAAGAVRICPECEEDPPPWQRARAALRYDDQARRVVLPLKYADRTEHAEALAPLMLRAGAILVREADVIVPVPLHRGRLIARRYNQAALIARAIGRLAGKPCLPDALQRTRSTTALAMLSAAERAAALQGAIAARALRASALAGRRVLLIDDVLTSGATARACTEALLGAGAAAVDVLVAARVADPRLR
jgi:ComF family protein